MALERVTFSVSQLLNITLSLQSGSCFLVLFVLSYCFSEMSPVCAVVGGVLGQEVVKVSMHTNGERRHFRQTVNVNNKI